MTQEETQRTGGRATAPSASPGRRGGEGASLSERMGGDGAAVDAQAETEVWSGRTSWRHFAGRLFLWAVVCVVAIVALVWAASGAEWLTAGRAFSIILAVVVFSGVVVVGKVAWTVLNHRYRLTSQRLFVEKGILSRTIDQTELVRVDDVRIHKSLTDRIFGLGTVSVLSTDATHSGLVILGVADADKVAEEIRGRMRAMRQKSLYVERL